MLIEVKEKHPPDGERKPGIIVTADGERLESWPETFLMFRVGMRYEVETKSRDYKGKTYRAIREVKPAGTATPAGFAREGAATATPAVAAPSGEAEFVGRVLHALILKGEVIYNENQLEKATILLRNIWNNTSSDQAHFRRAAE